jgi:hypothetical protein
VLELGELLGQLAHVVVVDERQRRDGRRPFRHLRPDDFGPNEVAQQLGARHSTLLYDHVQVIEQRALHRHAEPHELVLHPDKLAQSEPAAPGGAPQRTFEPLHRLARFALVERGESHSRERNRLAVEREALAGGEGDTLLEGAPLPGDDLGRREVNSDPKREASLRGDDLDAIAQGAREELDEPIAPIRVDAPNAPDVTPDGAVFDEIRDRTLDDVVALTVDEEAIADDAIEDRRSATTYPRRSPGASTLDSVPT